MIDKTYRILLERYMPDSPLLLAQEAESLEVRKTAITLEQLWPQVRSEVLNSYGLDSSGRHAFADSRVASQVLQKCSKYNVTNLPDGGIA